MYEDRQGHRRGVHPGGRSVASAALNPWRAFLDIASVDGGPGDAVRGLFLAGICTVGREWVIEGPTVDVLRMIRQAVANRWGRICAAQIRHGGRTVVSGPLSIGGVPYGRTPLHSRAPRGFRV